MEKQDRIPMNMKGFEGDNTSDENKNSVYSDKSLQLPIFKQTLIRD